MPELEQPALTSRQEMQQKSKQEPGRLMQNTSVNSRVENHNVSKSDNGLQGTSAYPHVFEPGVIG